MVARLILIILALLPFRGLYAAAANEAVFDELNCAVSMPVGWDDIDVPRPNYRVFSRSPDGVRTVILEVLEFGDPRAIVNEAFIAKRKDITKAGGARLISERRFSISGLPGFELCSHMVVNKTNASSIERLVIADGRL